MSFTYSPELVAGFSQENCLDIDVSGLSRSTHMQGRSLAPGSETAAFQNSRCFEKLEPLMLDPTVDELTSWLADFPVKPTPPQLRAEMLRTISGRKCGGWWQMSLPGTYLPKTSRNEQSTARHANLKIWATKPKHFPLARQTWVVTTFGNDTGYLHTPTCTANYAAPSMQKWASAREFVRVFGRPTPENHEWLMGWPIGWTGLQPLETGKYQLWQQLHGDC